MMASCCVYGTDPLYRCIQACRHILGTHDDGDAEALFSLAQALEALGRSEEAQNCASRASSLLDALP